jgi:hypothetical protein
MSTKHEAKKIQKAMAAYANTPGHGVPKTRREFLASGLIAASTSLIAPSMLGLLSRSAHAAALGCQAQTDLPCFINLQLAGGPAMFANHLAHGDNGTPLGSYGILGVGNGPAIAYHFNNNAPFFAPDAGRAGSGFLRGLKTRMGEDAFKEIVGGTSSGTPGKAAFIAVACKSIDDALTNKHDLTPVLLRAGLGGGALPYLLYQTNTGNDVNLGVNRFKGVFYDTPNYLMSSSIAAIEAGLGFKGTLLTQLKPAGGTANIKYQEELISAINDLSTAQAEAMLAAPGGKEARSAFYQAATCATDKNREIAKTQSTVQIDVSTDPALSAIWTPNFAAFTGGFDAEYKNSVNNMVGVSVSAAIRGLSGACTAVLGGYDYHAGQTDSRAAQDDKDQYFGEIVANILLTAKALNKRVFIYISADGSVGSTNDASTPPNQTWAGDYSERGMNYIIAYDPSSVVATRSYQSLTYKDAAFQLNHFARNSSEDLVVSSANPIANTDAQELAAAAVFTNYLAFAKRKDLLKSPMLAAVNVKLNNAMPGSASDPFNYFSRIQG